MGIDRIVRMGEVAVRAVEWLWSGRIPLGKLTMMVGDAGVGKSMVVLSMAAALSREGVGTLLLAQEDDAGDTLRPRLEAMGAELGRVMMMPELVTLAPTDEVRDPVNRIEEVLEAEPGIGLVVIDPLGAYLGGVERVNGVQTYERPRTVLAGLAEMARRRGVGLVVTARTTKRMGQGMVYRAAGSVGFTGLARMIYAVVGRETKAEGLGWRGNWEREDVSGEALKGANAGKLGCRAVDAEKAGTRSEAGVMVCLKSNLGERPQSLGFRMEEKGVVWEGEVAMTAEDLEEGAGRPCVGLDAAASWLEGALAEGPMEAAKVMAEGTREWD